MVARAGEEGKAASLLALLIMSADELQRDWGATWHQDPGLADQCLHLQWGSRLV